MINLLYKGTRPYKYMRVALTGDVSRRGRCHSTSPAQAGMELRRGERRFKGILGFPSITSVAIRPGRTRRVGSTAFGIASA